MSSNHLLSKPVHNTDQSLSFRASSATLFLSQHAPNSLTNGKTDPVDLSIANGLLQRDSPRIPKRRSSSNYVAMNPQSGLLVNSGGRPVEARPHYDRRSRYGISSNTWTSSSGEASEDDRNEDRTLFVEEYNRLAKKHHVQPIVPDEFIAVHVDQVVLSAKPGSWIMRKLLRRTSSVHLSSRKSEKHFRHKRSVSDMSLRVKLKKDSLKGKDLAELVRLCGTSPLYLPVEYAACTLAVPTCFRATAQYLVQHAAASRGIFRIPGSHSTISALYNHYASQDEEGEVIYGTVRCPTLPEHIQYNVHDVASAFKKFLAGLPGGILGKVWLFDAFLSIHAQLDAKAEAMRTKQSKVRARLIALAITTVAQRHRRELICAVMGLLSMIGRAAEIAPREDEHGRPLPTSDLMGYEALGIVFGPLLLGDLLDSHDLRPTGPNGNMVFIQRSPSKSSKSKHKKTKVNNGSNTLLRDTEKIRTVNSITEMLITHWRDIVRHMKDLGAIKSAKYHYDFMREKSRKFAPSSPIELFTIRQPRDWDLERSSMCKSDRSRSPTPTSRNVQMPNATDFFGDATAQQDAKLLVRKRMTRPRPMSSQTLSGAKSMSFLTPTAEEVTGEERTNQSVQQPGLNVAQNAVRLKGSKSARNLYTIVPSQTSQPSPKNLIATTPLEDSRLTECAVILSKSKTNDSRNTPVYDQDILSLDQHSLREREASNAKPLSDESKSSLCQTKTPLLNDSQKNNQDFRGQLITISSPPLDLECDQNQSEKVSHIPAGIVASRLRGIATGHVGLQTQSGLNNPFGVNRVAMSEKDYNPSNATGTPRTFIGFYQDPLTRVSQEEDIASLASLAEVIKLQDDNTNQECSQNMNSTKMSTWSATVIKPDARSSLSETSISEIYNEESPSKMSCQKGFTRGISSAAKTILRTDVDKWAVTPRRSTTEPSMPRLTTGATSVKALAAKFGNAETTSKRIPSPVRTPDSQVWRRSLAEKAIVATYTTNVSPVPMVRRREMLGTSFNSIASPSRMRMRAISSSSKVQSPTSALLTKKFSSNSNLKEDFGPSQWPNLHALDRNFQLGSGLVRAGSSNTINRSFVPNLHSTGDGNASFELPRMLSEESVKPMQLEQPVGEYAKHIQTTALYTPFGARPFDFLSSIQVKGEDSLSLFEIENPLKDQNTSLFYAQIQHVSKQLESKADEVDQLKRHLMTRDIIDDRAILIQLVEELKKELRLWRIRAEEAEHKVEIMSLETSKDLGDAIEQSTANAFGVYESDYNEKEMPVEDPNHLAAIK